MRQTPKQLQGRYPADRLGRFSYHTGAKLRPLEEDEPCPVLFRDLGFEALARFMKGELTRLAGPLSPIIYMRTEAYVEPYTDYAKTGRLVFLQPLRLQVWHSGVSSIYVASADRGTAEVEGAVGVVPGDIPLAQAAQRLADVKTTAELKEVFGGRLYEEQQREALFVLQSLSQEHAQAERLSLPLRAALKSKEPGRSEARARMAQLGIDEADLCAAWHHLPKSRRAHLVQALEALQQ